MKVLFKNRSFGGGAPKSLLSYIKLVKKAGIDVLSIGQFNYEPVDYKQENVPTINMDYFLLSRPILNFKLLKKYLKIIESEKPDVIHVTTIYNLYFQSIVEKLTGIPSIYMIPGGKISSFSARMIRSILKDKKIIVYSKENRLDLLKEGVSEDDILHISNRVDFSEFYNTIQSPEEIYNASVNEPIQALLISRFSETKIRSIKYTMELIQALVKDGLEIKLTVLGDGLLYEEMKKKAEEINKSVGIEIFSLVGYKSDVASYVKKSHIIFGKGRSVLDGIIQKRYSAVVTENREVYLCTEDNFKLISDFNITGRNSDDLTPTTYNTLLRLLGNIQSNQVKADELERVYEVAKNIYDVNEKEEQILALYNNHKKTQSKFNYSPSLIKLTIEFVKLYFFAVINAIKK